MRASNKNGLLWKNWWLIFQSTIVCVSQQVPYGQIVMMTLFLFKKASNHDLKCNLLPTPINWISSAFRCLEIECKSRRWLDWVFNELVSAHYSMEGTTSEEIRLTVTLQQCNLLKNLNKIDHRGSDIWRTCFILFTFSVKISFHTDFSFARRFHELLHFISSERKL